MFGVGHNITVALNRATAGIPCHGGHTLLFPSASRARALTCAGSWCWPPAPHRCHPCNRVSEPTRRACVRLAAACLRAWLRTSLVRGTFAAITRRYITLSRTLASECDRCCSKSVARALLLDASLPANGGGDWSLNRGTEMSGKWENKPHGAVGSISCQHQRSGA